MKSLFHCFLAITFIMADCSPKDSIAKNPPGYDLGKAEKYLMPESLQEISGICFRPGSTDTVYAIQDEDGKVFRLARGEKKQWHAKFARGGDYEDLSVLHDKMFVLRSNGHLYAMPFADLIYAEIDDVHEWKDLLPEGEYESLYADETEDVLYILCKHCDADEKKDQVTGYRMHAQSMQPMPFTIDVTSIRDKKGKLKRGFRPSGLAKHPVDHNWYIISAVNQLLVIANEKWEILDSYRLPGNTFNQPEGIAFDKEGNMFISNEGDDLTSGNILKFSWKPK